MAPNLVAGKYCYYISEVSRTESGGYVPVLVVEDETGFFPMSGRGNGAAPWVWGTKKADAERICAEANVKLGLTPERVAEIINSSFRSRR